jgi:ABC-type transporter Mla maintaining outer membrane lipid asymmetry permease subunit MlaE
LLPVRASLISAGLLFAMLAAVIAGLVLRPRANGWLEGLTRTVVFAVPLILVLTVVAHFLMPQP